MHPRVCKMGHLESVRGTQRAHWYPHLQFKTVLPSILSFSVIPTALAPGITLGGRDCRALCHWVSVSPQILLIHTNFQSVQSR